VKGRGNLAGRPPPMVISKSRRMYQVMSAVPSPATSVCPSCDCSVCSPHHSTTSGNHSFSRYRVDKVCNARTTISRTNGTEALCLGYTTWTGGDIKRKKNRAADRTSTATRTCRDPGTAVILVARWLQPQTAACHVRRLRRPHTRQCNTLRQPPLRIRPGATILLVLLYSQIANMVIKN